MANLNRQSFGDRGSGAEYIGPIHIPRSQERGQGENNTKPMILTANTGFEVAAQVSQTNNTQQKLPPGVEKPGPRPAVPIESAEYRQWYEKWYAYSQATGDMSYEEVQTMDVSSQSSHDTAESLSASASWSQESQQYYSSNDKPYPLDSGQQLNQSSNLLLQGNHSSSGETTHHGHQMTFVTSSHVRQGDWNNARANVVGNPAQSPYNEKQTEWQKNMDTQYQTAESASHNHVSLHNQFSAQSAQKYSSADPTFPPNEHTSGRMPRHQFQAGHKLGAVEHFSNTSNWPIDHELGTNLSNQSFESGLNAAKESETFHSRNDGIQSKSLNQGVYNRHSAVKMGIDSDRGPTVPENIASNLRTSDMPRGFETGRAEFLGRPPFLPSQSHIGRSHANDASNSYTNVGSNMGNNPQNPRLNRFVSQPGMERPSLSSANIRTSLTSSEHTNQNFAFQAQVRGLAPRVASNTNAIHSNSVLKHESVTQALVTNQNNSDGKGENAMVDALNRMKNTPNSLMASMMGKEGNIDQSAMNRMIASAMKNDPVVVQGLIGKMASGTMDPKDMTNAVTQIMQAAIGNRSMTMPTNPTVHQQLDNSMMGSSRLASPRNVRPMMKPSIPPNMPFNRPPIRQAMLGEKFMNRAPIASNQFTRGPVNSHIRAHKVPINTGVPHKSPWVGDESDAWQTQGPPSKKIKTDNPIAESTLVSPVGSSKPASQVPAAHHVTPERNNLLFMDQLRKAKRGGMDVRNMLIFCEVCDDVWGEKAHPVNDYVTHHVSSPDHCKGLIGWLDVHPNKRYQEMLTVPPHKPRCDAKKSAPLKEKLKYAYFCEVCEVPAGYCKKVYFQHMKLKSHLDKMVSLINTIKPQPSGAKKVEELKDAEYLLVPQRLPDLTREKNRLKRFPCQICSVAANDVGELTFDNWLGHMTTQFHMSILYDWLARCKAVAAVPYQKVMMFKGHTVAEKKDPHYFCEICLKRVKHEDEQYKRHLQSSKHLKNSKALTDEVNKALSGGPVTRILEEEKKSIDVYYDDIDEEWLHPHAQAHRETQQETAIETRRLAVENEMKQQITREAHPKTLPQNTTSEGTPPRSIAQQAVGTPSNVGQNRMQLKNSTRSEGPILRHIPPNASTPDLIRQPMPRVQNPHRLPGPRSEQLRMPPPRIAGQNFPRQRQMEAPSSDHKLQNPSLGHGTNAQTGGPSRMRMPPPVGFPNFENPRHPMPQNMPRNPLRNIPPRDQMIPPNLRPNNPRASMSRGQMPTPNMNRMPLPNIRHPPPQPNVVPPAHARPQPNIPPRPFGPRTISPRPIKVEGLEESPLDVPLVGPERLPMAHQRFIRPRLNAPTLPNRMNRPQAPRLLPPRSVVPQDGQEYFPDMPPQSPDAIEGRRIASQNIRMQGPNNMGPPRNRTAAPMQQLRGQAPTGTRGPMPFRPRGPLPVMDRPPLGMPHPIRNMRPRAMLHESAQNDAHFNEDVFEKNTFRTQNEPDSRFKSKEDQETLKNPTVAQDKWMEASERFVQQASQGLPIATKSSGCVDHQEKNASGHSLQSVMDIKFDSRPPAKTTPEHMHFHSSLEPHQHSTSHSELRVSTETDRFQQKRNDAPLSSAHERDILQEQRQLIKNALNSVKANDAMLKASEGRDGKPVQLMRSHNADLDRNSYSPNGLISQVPFSNEASLEPKLSPPFPRSQASKALLPTPGKLALLPTPAVSVATNNVFIQRERGPDDYLLFPDKLTKLAILPAFPLNDAYCELCPQIPAFSDIVEWVEHVSTLPHMMTLFRIAETRRGPLAHHLCGKVVIPPHGPQNNYYICEVCCILNTENNMIDHLSARKHLINLKNLAVTMRDSCAWMREFLISSKKEFWNRADDDNPCKLDELQLHAEWISTDLKRLIDKRNRAYSANLKFPSKHANEKLQLLRKQVKQMLRKEKCAHFKINAYSHIEDSQKSDDDCQVETKGESSEVKPPSEGKSGAGVMTNTSKPEYDVETGSSTSNLFDFQDPQMAFLHSVLTGVVALTTFKDMKEEGGDIPVDLEAKIGREQRVIVEKMCTKSGHLVISIARRVIEKERKEKILEYYPEVKPQFVDIVTGLQPDILKLIADTPILDRPPS